MDVSMCPLSLLATWGVFRLDVAMARVWNRSAPQRHDSISDQGFLQSRSDPFSYYRGLGSALERSMPNQSGQKPMQRASKHQNPVPRIGAPRITQRVGE